MVHAECVFVAGIHPSRTWMSGSFESVPWNACVHWLDLDYTLIQKCIGGAGGGGGGVKTYVNSKGKIPCTGKILPRGGWNPRRCIKQDSEPNTLPTSYSGPRTPFWVCAMQLGLEILFVGCLTSQQQASVSQGRICSDNFTCCHTEIEVADPTFYFTQSQYTDTKPTSPSADPITPGTWQGSHWSANFEITGMTRSRKKSRRKRDSNPGSSALEADALTTRPTRR